MIVSIPAVLVDDILQPSEPYPKGYLGVHFDGENYVVEVPDPPEEPPADD